MATNGYIRKTVTADGYIYLQLNWTAGTQNIANNYTPISWDLKIVSTNSSANISSSVAKNLSISIDGDTVFNGTDNVTINGGATKTLANGNKNIYHNSDGTKTFAANFSQQFDITYSGSRIGTVTGSGSGTLNTIPRATTPTVSGSQTLGGTITVSTASRASTSFIHNLYYSWGSQVIGQRFATGITTSASLLIPKTLANYIPNGTAGTMFINCETYNGSTLVGTKTISITVTMPNTAEFNPSISDITLAEGNSAVPSAWGLFVKGNSKINGTVVATGAYNSTISSYKVTINGTIYTSRTFLTDVLNTSGTNTVSATIVDSRGRSKTFSKTFNVIDYEKPYITTFTVTRVNATTATLKLVGGVYAVSNKNAKTFSYKYKKKSDSTYTTVPITNSAYTIDTTITVTGLEDVTYDFVGVIGDTFNTGNNAPQKTTTLPTTNKIFNVNRDKNAMAFFKKAEKTNAIEMGKDVFDRFDTRYNNGLAQYRLGGSDIDPDDTLDELILTETNTPEGGFWYIRTIFYNTKTATSNRTQLAFPYAYNSNRSNKCFIRIYVSGIGWGVWASLNETTNAVNNYVGNSLIGSDLYIQWGMVLVTPVANTPTQQTVYFGKTFEKPPIVIPVSATGVPGTGVTGVSVVSSTTTSAAIALTRINTVQTSVHFIVIGKLA